MRGTTERIFRTLLIGGKPTSVVFQVPRVGCLRCHPVRQVKVNFADPKKHYTRSFERYALKLSRRMTIHVANHLQVSWDTIKDFQVKNLKRRFRNSKLGKLKQIAIDEFAVGKANLYLTVVLNHLTRHCLRRGTAKASIPWNLLETRTSRPSQYQGRGHRHVRGIPPSRT